MKIHIASNSGAKLSKLIGPDNVLDFINELPPEIQNSTLKALNNGRNKRMIWRQALHKHDGKWRLFYVILNFLGKAPMDIVIYSLVAPDTNAGRTDINHFKDEIKQITNTERGIA
jgi:hypothetical protein